MSPRLVLCVALLGCGGPSKKTAAPAPPPSPAPAPAPAQVAAAPAPPATAPAAPAAPKRLAPPQRWDEVAKRPDGSTFVMGYVEWTGGEQFNVQVMGTMKMVLQQSIDDAIKQKPDDPAAAIQGVMDETNQLGGADSPLQWVRKQ